MTPPTVDLSALSAADIEHIWWEIKRAHDFANADPELRKDITHALTAALDAGQIDESRALEIDVMLESAVPAVVLEQCWRELIPNKPALGAFPRRDPAPAPDIDEWYRIDPTRLSGLVQEMGRFTTDIKGIAVAVLDSADKFGIPEDQADRIISEALHALNSEQRKATSNGR